jgi:hypothetical protein
VHLVQPPACSGSGMSFFFKCVIWPVTASSMAQPGSSRHLMTRDDHDKIVTVVLVSLAPVDTNTS